jgi:hypothetical protein
VPLDFGHQRNSATEGHGISLKNAGKANQSRLFSVKFRVIPWLNSLFCDPLLDGASKLGGTPAQGGRRDASLGKEFSRIRRCPAPDFRDKLTEGKFDVIQEIEHALLALELGLYVSRDQRGGSARHQEKG